MAVVVPQHAAQTLTTGEPTLGATNFFAWFNKAVGQALMIRDGPIQSCALLTTEPNEMAAKVHNRMPVILPDEAFSMWLDPKTPADRLQEWLPPAPEDLLDSYPVSRAVNVVKTNGPQCIEPFLA